MKVLKKVILIILLLAAVGGGLYYYMLPEEVSVTFADKGIISPKLNLTGNIEGNENITIYADVSGTISGKYVNKGERVSEGDLLLTYGDEDQKNAVDVAQTNIEYGQKIIDSISGSRAENQNKLKKANERIGQCEVVYATLKMNIMSIDSNKYAKDYDRSRNTQIIQNDIIKMQDEVSSRQSELAKIEIELKKAELLGDNSGVARLAEESKQIQDQISETNTAISKCQRDMICLPLEGMDPATYDQYILLQNDLETVTRLWSEARTDRDTAQSLIRAYDEILGTQQKKALDELSLDQALTELEKAQDGCVAPSDGVITGCYVDEGANVEKGAPVFEMQKADNYKVKLLISKYDISSVKVGQTAVINIGDTEYRGRVENISQYAEADASGKAKAAVDIELFTTDTLIVGMEADVIINLETTIDALRVPNECLYTDDDGTYLFIVDIDKNVRKKYVSVGVKDDLYTQILSGISENEMIVNDLSAAEYEDQEIEPLSAQ
ncbi:MAG: HlyD family efflux transporter periplasmic adaptor subunit [Lachnospiraceae bacterium]|nr:HlyD family efflux transporter periplasmic adaptor subunit [Lachnospiraceae bacterium]